jgi:hypothetical protein
MADGCVAATWLRVVVWEVDAGRCGTLGGREEDSLTPYKIEDEISPTLHHAQLSGISNGGSNFS